MSLESLSETDREDLHKAKILVQSNSFAMQVAQLVGTPIEIALELLPDGTKNAIAVATNKALESALSAAVSTMTEGKQTSSEWLHKIAVMSSGAAGGFFGLLGLSIELPVSTTIMLRSIADIARSEGETISSTESQLACLEVFALGGPSTNDDATETGYYAVRSVLGKALQEAAEFLAKQGTPQVVAPPIVRIIAAIAERFGVQVSEKVIAQSLPVIGAAGGAIINSLFIDHFQTVARGHFIIRRLERKHGKEVVEAAFNNLCDTSSDP